MEQKILFEVIFAEGQRIGKISIAEFEYLSGEKGIRLFQKKNKTPLFFLDSYQDVRKKIGFLVEDFFYQYETTGLVYLVKEDTYCCALKNKSIKSIENLNKQFLKKII